MSVSGQEEQFVALYDEFADALLRHAVFRLSDHEKAKDVVQETFIRFWNTIASGKEVISARPLLYTIINNLIVDEYRKKKMVSLDTLRDETGFDIEGENLKASLEVQDEASRVTTLIGYIPDPYREVFIMRHIDGFSVKEIAHILKLSENVVSVRIHRALQKIKSIYHEEHS